MSTATVNLGSSYNVEGQVIDNPFLKDALGDLISDKGPGLTFCFIYNSNASQDLLGQIFETLHTPLSSWNKAVDCGATTGRKGMGEFANYVRNEILLNDESLKGEEKVKLTSLNTFLSSFGDFSESKDIAFESLTGNDVNTLYSYFVKEDSHKLTILTILEEFAKNPPSGQEVLKKDDFQAFYDYFKIIYDFAKSIHDRTKTFSGAAADLKKAFAPYEKKVRESEHKLLQLLQLALRNNPANGGKVKIGNEEHNMGFKITAIKKFVDSAGNVTYTPIIAKDNDGNLAMDSSRISIDALSKYWNVPYFAMAMCYEMALVVKEMIIAQVDAIDKANKAIKENNEYLKYANSAYHNYYTWAIYRNETGDAEIVKVFELEKNTDGTTTPSSLPAGAEGRVSDFLNYLKIKCDVIDQTNINSKISYGKYNTEGGSGGDRSNIDVQEQGFLSQISNWQEAIRQRGDLLSTDTQEMTTKLTQYTQAFNNNLQGCSDMNKGIYSSTRVVTSNIRP